MIRNPNIHFKPNKGWVLFTLRLRNEKTFVFFLSHIPIFRADLETSSQFSDHSLLDCRSMKFQVQSTDWMNSIALDDFWLDHKHLEGRDCEAYFFDLSQSIQNTGKFFQGKTIIILVFKQVFISTAWSRADDLWKHDHVIHSTVIFFVLFLFFVFLIFGHATHLAGS